MFEIVFLVLAVGLMVLAWWWLSRRRRELLGGLGGGEPDDAGWPAEQTLTRDALVKPSREFDPSAWDDSPNPAAAAAKPAPARPAAGRPAPARPVDGENETPAYFDRDFLERQRRQRAIDTDPPPSD